MEAIIIFWYWVISKVSHSKYKSMVTKSISSVVESVDVLGVAGVELSRFSHNRGLASNAIKTCSLTSVDRTSLILVYSGTASKILTGLGVYDSILNLERHRSRLSRLESANSYLYGVVQSDVVDDILLNMLMVSLSKCESDEDKFDTIKEYNCYLINKKISNEK